MITIEKFKFSDIPTMIRWFKMDHVREYWVSILNKTDKEIKDKYVKRLNKDDINMFIIKKNNQDIGYIQTYFVEEMEPFGVVGISKGIDLFIGEVDFLNQGIGTEALRIFISNCIFNERKVKFACIDPEVRNKRAIRAYEKVGFKHSNTSYCKYSKLLTYYMVLDRNDFLVI